MTKRFRGGEEEKEMDQNQSFGAHSGANGSDRSILIGQQKGIRVYRKVSGQKISSDLAELEKKFGKKGILIGRPIPRDFFETTGKGESDNDIHAGSYHLALQEAGIERANIMSYSSIMPAIARRISKEDGMKQIIHGEELKVIQASSSIDTTKGEQRATAAIVYGFLYPKSGGETIGGLVCEYSKHGTIEEARAQLTACLKELFESRDAMGRRFADDCELRDVRFIAESIEPKKRFGTALAVIAFVNHFVPVLGQNVVRALEMPIADMH